MPFKNMILTIIILLVIDGLWIGYLARDLYISQLGHLMRFKNGALAPNYLAALFTYVLITLGITLLVLPLAGNNVMKALGYGMIFGLTSYGMYDFTNLATLNHWPLSISLIDMFWGTFLCGVTSAIVTWLSKL